MAVEDDSGFITRLLRYQFDEGDAPALEPDVDSAMSFAEDETSDIEEGVEFSQMRGREPRGRDIEDEEGEELEGDDYIERLEPSALPNGLNISGYQPLEGQSHSRKWFLPTGFYNQPYSSIPAACVSDCNQEGTGLNCACSGVPLASDLRYDLPLLFFKLFFTKEVFEGLAANTNAYADFKDARGEGRRSWSAVTAGELKIWIGLIIYMSVNRQSRTEEFWYRKPDWPSHCITRFRGRTRFEQIKRYFHISPPVESLPRSRFYEKLEPLASLVKESFKRVLLPATPVAVDEMIIRFTGRSKHTIMMRGKPVPVGYNVLALCEAGYCWTWLFTSPLVHVALNQCGREGVQSSIVPEALPKLSKSVLNLALQLPQHHFFQLYCDNLFSNADLFHFLRAHGIAATGTARSTSRNWPQNFKQRINRKTTRFPFNSQFAEVVYGDVCAIVWQDKNLVQFLTTAYDPTASQTVTRRRPAPRTKWLKQVVDQYWGNCGQVMLLQPSYSIDYNNYMNGVDRHDQLRSYTNTQLKALRTWFALFFFILDAAVINSWLMALNLHKQSNNQYITRQRSFRLRLAWNLVLEGAS